MSNSNSNLSNNSTKNVTAKPPSGNSFKIKKIQFDSTKKVSQNNSTISTDLETQRMEKVYLSDINSKNQNFMALNINKNISKRLTDDRNEF
jgi:hypothetical protein